MNREDRRSPLWFLGGRRFALTLGAGMVTSLLLYLDKLDSAAYASIIIATVGAYIAGDAFEHKQNVKANDESGWERARD